MGLVVILNTSGFHADLRSSLELCEEPSFMMTSTNLLAPKPHGSKLIQHSIARMDQLLGTLSEQDVEVIATRQLSPTQTYELARRSRNRVDDWLAWEPSACYDKEHEPK